MRLVYRKHFNGERNDPHVEVKVGDQPLLGGKLYIVESFNPPIGPISSGTVVLRRHWDGETIEVFTGQIGAVWIEQEDRKGRE